MTAAGAIAQAEHPDWKPWWVRAARFGDARIVLCDGRSPTTGTPTFKRWTIWRWDTELHHWTAHYWDGGIWDRYEEAEAAFFEAEAAMVAGAP